MNCLTFATKNVNVEKNSEMQSQKKCVCAAISMTDDYDDNA